MMPSFSAVEDLLARIKIFSDFKRSFACVRITSLGLYSVSWLWDAIFLALTHSIKASLKFSISGVISCSIVKGSIGFSVLQEIFPITRKQKANFNNIFFMILFFKLLCKLIIYFYISNYKIRIKICPTGY